MRFQINPQRAALVALFAWFTMSMAADKSASADLLRIEITGEVTAISPRPFTDPAPIAAAFPLGTPVAMTVTYDSDTLQSGAVTGVQIYGGAVTEMTGSIGSYHFSIDPAGSTNMIEVGQRDTDSDFVAFTANLDGPDLSGQSSQLGSIFLGDPSGTLFPGVTGVPGPPLTSPFDLSGFSDLRGEILFAPLPNTFAVHVELELTSVRYVPVPEPASFGLLAMGSLLILKRRRRERFI